MRHATTFAVVPVKALGLAKRRLAPALPDAARRRLVLTMLEDILTAAVSVEGIARILVVTPDREVAALAERRGAAIVPEPNIEPGSQLNAAVEGGIAFALARGAAQALILPADVPLATPAELASLIESRGVKPGVTLAHSHDSNGDNALLLSRKAVVELKRWYHLRAELQGTTFSFFVDDQLIGRNLLRAQHA